MATHFWWDDDAISYWTFETQKLYDANQYGLTRCHLIFDLVLSTSADGMSQRKEMRKRGIFVVLLWCKRFGSTEVHSRTLLWSFNRFILAAMEAANERLEEVCCAVLCCVAVSWERRTYVEVASVRGLQFYFFVAHVMWKRKNACFVCDRKW